jgi:hypothetical protein
MTMVDWTAAAEDHVDEHKTVRIPNRELESDVTTAFGTETQPQRGNAPTFAANVTIVVLGVALAVALAIAGVTFFALAIAFPIALTVADAVRAYVSPSDLAIATQLAAIWPVFVVASVASFGASVAVVVKLIQRASPVRPA